MNKEEFEKDLFERILSAMKRNGLERCATSVLLAGSFGRDEATYELIDGNAVLKSDVEIGIVYKSKKAVLQMIDAISDKFEEDLSCMPLSKSRLVHLHNFNNALMPSKYKNLFMYDLVHGHRTIWGVDYLAGKEIAGDQIDAYEGKRIVANRIGELIYTREKHRSDGLRWEAKLISAMGTAYLLHVGKYTCSYIKQMEEIEKLQKELDEALGDGFYDKYVESFAFLRQGSGVFHVEEDVLRAYVKKINAMFEAANIKRPRINTLSRNIKYALKYVKREKNLSILGMESRILDGLIQGFVEERDDLLATAKLWYDVLY